MRTEDTDLVVLGESALPHVVDPSGGKLLLSVGPAKQPLPEPNDAIQAIHSSIRHDQEVHMRTQRAKTVPSQCLRIANEEHSR